MRHIIKLSLLVLVGCLLWSFSSKTDSTVNSNNGITLQSQPVTDSAALEAGKDLYSMKCQKCHRLHSPDEYTQVKWGDKILPKMSKKAKLTPEQNKSIETYLFANCKKE